MDEDKFNMSVRRFLKQVGVSSQRELETLARSGHAEGKKKLKVKMVLTAKGTGLEHIVEDEIEMG